MRNRFFRLIAISAVVCMTSFADSNRATARAQIPFQFRMGASVLPAGQYTLIEDAQTGYVVLANKGTNARAGLFAAASRSLTSADTCKLVFHRYGDRYFLAEVWSPNGGYLRKLPKTAAEQELANANQPPQIAYVLVKVAR